VRKPARAKNIQVPFSRGELRAPRGRDTRQRACSVNSDWTFAVVTECQRFVCAASMEGTLDDGPRSAAALRGALPPADSLVSARFVRAMLLEIAVRWGTEQHQRFSHRCRSRPCAVAALVDSGAFWPSESHSQIPADLFVAHVTAIRDELARTHGASLAQRAVALFVESGGSTTVEDVARSLGTHPSTLRRAFRREVRMTAREYLARVRIAKAEAMLGGGQNLKVEPIAYAVGWSSKSGLYRAFRQFRDDTPGQARNTP
jgi:transcriptional regulator GlxA family with amidase domain